MAPKRKSNKVVVATKGPALPSNFSRIAPDPVHDVHENVKPNTKDATDAVNSGNQPADDPHDEQDDNNTTEDDDRISSIPPVPSNLHRDMSHIAKHLQDQSASLFSAINFMHYIKYSIGTAIQSVVSRLIGAAEIIVKSMDEAKKWIIENPGKTVILIISGTTVVAPGFIAGSALEFFGFAVGGVGGGWFFLGGVGFGTDVLIGTLAVGLHAVLGDVAAGSVFAVLQSAGAGGTGLAVVNGVVVQAVAVGTDIWTAWRKKVSGMDRGDGSVDLEEMSMESTATLLPGTDTSHKAKNRTAKIAGGFNTSGIKNETRTVKEELTATEKKTIKNRKRKASKKKAKAKASKEGGLRG
ncbi:hypothetical protein E6O75_ATG11595 [Venturia nashicola]|uniref:Uncharacterized protein n=1 Tax=Venturia nashicola TaxID=86259 RepID=A0A4Z1P7G1_9PEZI|nr:hypothetical protein E6O75_ATG11595 [Venturia nashicola]